MAVDRLVLWDIDKTLLSVGGVGTEAFGAAFEELTGASMREMADAVGRTERHILRRTIELHDLDPNDYSFDRFAALEAAEYRARVEQIRMRGSVLPGARSALAALGRLPHILQTVLTGNTREGAEAKLDAFGLVGLDLHIGAYGDLSEYRPDLVPVARSLAERRSGKNYAGERTVIIGDTEHDIAAAREHGARVIAVATGLATRAELERAGADIVLPDLSGTMALLAHIGG